jgi:prophage maintenance system killer protein
VFNEGMTNTKDMEVVIYKDKEGDVEMKVNVRDESTRLSQDQISKVFGTKRPAITKHLNNIFRSGELDKNRVCSKMEHTALDGKKYITLFYNLDAIISVGYRVNSKKATQFRIWATRILKDYLIKGYSINQKLLSTQENKFKELQTTIDFIEEKSKDKLLDQQTHELLSLIKDYTRSLKILEEYDKGRISKKKGSLPIFEIDLTIARKIIKETREQVGQDLFGVEVEHKFEGLMACIYQTFDGVDLYKTVEEKAANLLYLMIKDHPFADGNKRSGSMLFVYYLNRNNILYKDNGERKINDNALVALSLLVAVSQPREKDILIKVIISLIS